MRTVLTAVCGLTALESAWLFVMFLVLRHPGFEARASLALMFAAGSVATVAAVRKARSSVTIRTLVVIASMLFGALGVYAVISNHQGAHFEGYLDVLGLSFVAQGVVGCAAGLRRAG